MLDTIFSGGWLLTDEFPTQLFISSFTAVSLLVYIILVRTLSPLGGIPGPFWASITNLWIVHKTRQLHRQSLDVELHKKYGPLVRIGPNIVSVGSPSVVKTIYSKSNCPKAAPALYFRAQTLIVHRGWNFKALSKVRVVL